MLFFKAFAVGVLLACILVTARAVEAQEVQDWRFPAEFEAQETVWLGWLSQEYIKGFRTDDVLLKIVKNLVPHVNVRICVPDEAHKQLVSSLLLVNEVDSSRVSFFTIPFTALYWRDFGPIFTVNGQGQKSIADFNFNSWGYFSDTDLQSRIMERVDREAAKFLGIPSRMTRLVSEGGDREFNGKGTILLTEACEFHRNPNLSREEIEEQLTEMLGVSNFIWLKQGGVEDDAFNTSTLPGPDGKGVAYRSGSANNHMDEYCRFVSFDTILLAEVSEQEAKAGPVAQENRRRMEANYEILKAARDQDGKPFKILRIPMPEMMYFTARPEDKAYMNLSLFPRFTDGASFPLGEPVTVVPAQSYCNFLITNGLVLAQKYWMEGAPHSVKEKDDQALKVLQKAFPDRKVVTLNALAINFGGGGIHCVTQQEPAVP